MTTIGQKYCLLLLLAIAVTPALSVNNDLESSKSKGHFSSSPAETHKVGSPLGDPVNSEQEQSSLVVRHPRDTRLRPQAAKDVEASKSGMFEAKFKDRGDTEGAVGRAGDTDAEIGAGSRAGGVRNGKKARRTHKHKSKEERSGYAEDSNDRSDYDTSDQDNYDHHERHADFAHYALNDLKHAGHSVEEQANYEYRSDDHAGFEDHDRHASHDHHAEHANYDHDRENDADFDGAAIGDERGEYDGGHGEYEDEQGEYDEQRDEYDEGADGYDDEPEDYDAEHEYYDDEDSGYDDDQSGYDDGRNAVEAEDGTYDGERAEYDSEVEYGDHDGPHDDADFDSEDADYDDGNDAESETAFIEDFESEDQSDFDAEQDGNYDATDPRVGDFGEASFHADDDGEGLVASVNGRRVKRSSAKRRSASMSGHLPYPLLRKQRNAETVTQPKYPQIRNKAQVNSRQDRHGFGREKRLEPAHLEHAKVARQKRQVLNRQQRRVNAPRKSSIHSRQKRDFPHGRAHAAVDKAPLSAP
ncbi:protein starmaker-like [Galendromus occidentalis]|uniref:Protein starmaker-like n=1 Tax=Galendromus occidentalis TaxID=34638 RepID=A0AAJ7L734_9ACAR|nr:protein starmaker-like [Galendromus occidentalis]